MTELERYLERHQGRPQNMIPDHDLLLLDIAKSLRGLLDISRQAYEFNLNLAQSFNDMNNVDKTGEAHDDAGHKPQSS